MSDKISLKEKIGYGFGDAASSMFWKIFGMYSLFFYTDVFGISAAATGTMFLVARIWDSFFDVFVGIMADRTKTRWENTAHIFCGSQFHSRLWGFSLFMCPNSGRPES